MNVIWIALTILFLAPQTSSPPTTGTASIAGTVVDDQERAVHVRRAVVTVSGAGLVPSRSAITDDDGRFVIERLPAGRFTISVSRAAFVTSLYGARRPGKPGTPVVVAAGQRVTGLSVKLWRGAVIAGVVRTEKGEPAEGLPVRVIAAHQTPEPSILTLDNNGVKRNDAGEFRIFGLPPGTYLLAVTPPVLRGAPPTAMSEEAMDAALTAMRTRTAPAATSRAAAALPPTTAPFAYAAIYFPGSANMNQARPITLAAGQVADGIDLQLQRVPTASVDGVVTMPDGGVAAGASIQIMQTPPRGYSLDTPLQVSATALPDGRFRLPGVSPGDYVITAKALPGGGRPTGMSGGPALWSETTVSVSGQDISGVALSLAPGPALAGRVAFIDGTMKPPADLAQWRVSVVTPASLARRGPIMGSEFNQPPAVTLKPDGTFQIDGIPPGEYLFQLTGPGVGPAGWWMRSMISEDRDLLDRLIVVRPGTPSMNVVVSMSDRHTELSGTLRTSTGQPQADVFVIAFSSDRTLWGRAARRVRAVRPGADGKYSIADLPPGDYFVGVMTDIDADDVQDSALLEQLMSTSVKVTIGEGEKKVQDLQLGKGD